MFSPKMRGLFLLLVLLASAGFFYARAVQAQTAEAVQNRRASLESELKEVEKQIEIQSVLLRAKQAETASIGRDVEILTTQIARAKLNIKAKQINIEQLGGDIKKKTALIGTLEEKIAEQKKSLAELLRKTRDLDSVSLVEAVLSEDRFSNLASVVDELEFVQGSIHQAFQTMREDRSETEKERTGLEGRRKAEVDAQKVIEEERRLITQKEAEKKSLLAMSKSQEKTYGAILQNREKRAAEIRSALFALRDTAAIPFGTALKFANQALAKTGVRPAFLLAILTQETNLGENVGTCNRPSDPPTKHWKAIMPGPGDKSSRDDESAYLRIIKGLGFDPDSMPLSCPWNNGWGGAMGPSQFIPTTWESYQSKVSTMLGKTTANPWEPEDAFMASALFLSDLGAGRGGYSAEREAALRYYAGGNWFKAKNAFYGDQVMKKATEIQENMINILQNS